MRCHAAVDAARPHRLHHEMLRRQRENELLDPWSRDPWSLKPPPAAASVAAAEAVGAMTKVMKPAAKAPAATPASTRLPVRIALDNAFPFVNARPLFGPPGAEGSISDVPGRNERQTR